jgi:hypothetical protein
MGAFKSQLLILRAEKVAQWLYQLDVARLSLIGFAV